MSDISIRDLHPEDEPAVRRVVSTVLEEFNLHLDRNDIDSDLEDIAASYLARGGVFKVLVQSGEVVGCGGLYPLDEEEAEVRKMYFLPHARGRGFGRVLLDDLVASARGRGFTRVVLETAAVLKGAIALYRSYGFVPQQREHLTECCDQAFTLELRK